MWSLTGYHPAGTFPASERGSPEIAPPELATCSSPSPTFQRIFTWSYNNQYENWITKWVLKDDIYYPRSHALNGSGASSVQRATMGWSSARSSLHLLCFKPRRVPVGSQCLEDLIHEPMGASVILVNVMKHIVEALPGPGPPHPVDGSLLAWINNK